MTKQKPEMGAKVLVTIMLLRLAIISGFICILALVLPGDSYSFYGFMGVAYIVTIPYALWLRDRVFKHAMVPLQFVVDLVWVTGMVYFTGGVHSELFMLYPLVIMSAGIVCNAVRAAQIAVLSILFYVTLVVLDTSGVLVSYNGGQPSFSPEHLYRAMGLRVFIFLCFAAASTWVANRCRWADKQALRFRDTAEAIFRHVRAGLLLLDEEGTIILANTRAAEMLEREEKELQGLNMKDLMDRSWNWNLMRMETDPVPCRFKRPSGTSLPASLEMASLRIPAWPGRRSSSGEVEAYVAVFNDLSRFLQIQQNVETVKSGQALNRMAADIADEIRNPLTAISGALQVIQALEQRRLLDDDAKNEQLLAEKNKLFDTVLKESSRLDTTMQRFIDYAECSPEALEQLLKYRQEDSINEPAMTRRATMKTTSQWGSE